MSFKNVITIISLILIVSCSNKEEKIVDLFDLETEEAVVVKYYQDSTPEIVNYYKKDVPKDVHGIVGQVSYYENNHEYMGGRMKNGKRDGVWRAFFKTGVLQSDAFYREGKIDGDYKIYHDNGQLIYLQHYTQGVCSGKWEFYDNNGKLTKQVEVTNEMIMCEGCSKCRMLRSKQN